MHHQEVNEDKKLKSTIKKFGKSRWENLAQFDISYEIGFSFEFELMTL